MNISSAVPWIDEDIIDDSLRIQMEQEERLKNEPLDFSGDPLAAAWASYGVWKKRPGQRWVPFTDVMISDHDREIAAATRRYYRDKIALQSLRQGKVSEFRQDLYDICNGGVIRNKHVGMLYRLPYFYVEDIERDRLRESIQHQPDAGGDLVPGIIADKEIRTLTRDRQIFCSRRRQEVMEYWFRDDRGHPVKWSTPYDADHRALVESIFNHDGIRIRAFYRRAFDRRVDFYYWRVIMPELVFDGGSR